MSVPRRRWFRFSLRTLLAAVTVLAAAAAVYQELGWRGLPLVLLPAAGLWLGRAATRAEKGAAWICLVGASATAFVLAAIWYAGLLLLAGFLYSK